MESNEACMWRQGGKLLRTMAFSVPYQQIPNCVHTEYTTLGADVSPGYFLVSFGPITTCQFFPLMCKRKLSVHPHHFLGSLKCGLVELLLVWRGTWPGWYCSPQTWLSHWAHLWPLNLHVSEAAYVIKEWLWSRNQHRRKHPKVCSLGAGSGTGDAELWAISCWSFDDKHQPEASYLLRAWILRVE